MATRAEKRREQFRKAREAGATPEQARRLRDLSAERFGPELKQALREVAAQPRREIRTVTPRQFERRARQIGEDKETLWSMWSNTEFPPSVDELIREMNVQKGVRTDHPMGHAIVYRHLVEGEDLDDAFDAVRQAFDDRIFS